ncbi:arginine--tRNA ligase [Shigella flexneri]
MPIAREYYIDSRQHQHRCRHGRSSVKQAMHRNPYRWNTTCSARRRGRRKPFKTRAGGTVKLADPLDEASERAGGLVARKRTRIRQLTSWKNWLTRLVLVR